MVDKRTDTGKKKNNRYVPQKDDYYVQTRIYCSKTDGSGILGGTVGVENDNKSRIVVVYFKKNK